MGGCSSHEDNEKKECTKHATLKEIRNRLATIFDRMDVNGEGQVSYGQAMKFIRLSRRDISKGKEQDAEITQAVKKMFACAKTNGCREHITEDEFIAG